MNRYITRCLFMVPLILIALVGLGQPAAWTVDPTQFQYSMTLTWKLSMQSGESMAADDYMAAFVGEEVRGVTKPTYNPILGEYYFLILVYSNAGAGETVTFKFYNASAGDIEDITLTYSFVAESSQGSFSDPITYEFPEELVISSDEQIDGSQHILYGDLQVEASVTLTVKAGSTLEVIGDITNNGNIIIESGASLITYSGYSLSGNDITIYRNTRYAGGKYSFVGTPVQQSPEITGADLGSYVFKYDETAGYDADAGLGRWKDASADELVPGVGYTQAFQEELVFSGVPNTGTVTMSGLTKTSAGTASTDNQGWHLLSNPYAAAIDLEKFLDDNGLSSVYLWDDQGSEEGRGDNSDYLVASAIGVVSGPNGGSFNGYIGSGQGFFVQVASGGATVVFNEAQRVPGNNADTNFFRGTIEKPSRLKLALNGDYYNELLIGFVEGATPGEDPRYDARKLVGNENIAFYSFIGDNRFAIQGLPEITGEVTISLGYQLREAGVYDLSVIEAAGIPVGYTITAAYTGEKYDLTDGATSLYLESGTGEIELSISAATSSLEVLSVSNPEDRFTVFGGQGRVNLRMDTSAELVDIVILDFQGKVMASWSGQGISHGEWTGEVSLKSRQIYIVRVAGGGQLYSGKFVYD